MLRFDDFENAINCINTCTNALLKEELKQLLSTLILKDLDYTSNHFYYTTLERFFSKIINDISVNGKTIYDGFCEVIHLSESFRYV